MQDRRRERHGYKTSKLPVHSIHLIPFSFSNHPHPLHSDSIYQRLYTKMHFSTLLTMTFTALAALAIAAPTETPDICLAICYLEEPECPGTSVRQPLQTTSSYP
ncbi:hypothetical protein BJY00DRAFT_294408 [Aspergillus carlsbadensis]|nr:hypothetical protein BJY00DRAFT_294408 [Aspergillus carlsbadensis]